MLIGWAIILSHCGCSTNKKSMSTESFLKCYCTRFVFVSAFSQMFHLKFIWTNKTRDIKWIWRAAEIIWWEIFEFILRSRTFDCRFLYLGKSEHSVKHCWDLYWNSRGEMWHYWSLFAWRIIWEAEDFSKSLNLMSLKSEEQSRL